MHHTASFRCNLVEHINDRLAVDRVHSSSTGKLDNQRCKDPQLRDPQKLSEKWRIHCASIRLDEHGCRCCISLSIIFSAIFQDVFRFLLLSARMSMNSKMAWAIWMFQNGRSPNRGNHGRSPTGICCWVNFASYSVAASPEAERYGYLATQSGKMQWRTSAQPQLFPKWWIFMDAI